MLQAPTTRPVDSAAGGPAGEALVALEPLEGSADGQIELEALLEALPSDLQERVLVPAEPEPGGREFLSYDAVIGPYMLVFIVAFVMAYIFTPIMQRVAHAYDIVDRPDGEAGRKLHRRPTAYLGGVAVYVGMVASLAVGQWLCDLHHPDTPGDTLWVPAPIVAGMTVITILGLIDDVRGIRPVVKILGQVAAAVCLLVFGVGDQALDSVSSFGFAWVDARFGLALPEAVEAVASTALNWGVVIALVVFCCNASNLMDGLDGLCGGVTAIIAGGLVFVAASVALGGDKFDAFDDAIRIVLALALFGAVLGFLPFNFNPASIFMGDAGSLLMGFVVATLIVLLGEAGSKWLLGGLVMFSLPVLDTALAFARRWLAGRPLFSADKHHFHHQLIGRGLTVRRAVVLSYGLSIFFVAAGVMLVFLRTRYAVAFYLVLFGCIIVAAYKMGMVHERIDRRHERENRNGAKPSAPSPTPASAKGDAPPRAVAFARDATDPTDATGREADVRAGVPSVSA